MKRASGEKWWAPLERAYIAHSTSRGQESGPRNGDCVAETTYKDQHSGKRKLVAFLRYSKGRQVPRGTSATGGPLQWAMENHPAFAKTYESPLFKLLKLGADPVALIDFSRNLYKEAGVSSELLSKTMRKSHLMAKSHHLVPIWSEPRDVVKLRHIAEPDALCLILIALKANSGRTHETQCLAICAEWLRAWVEQLEPHEDLVGYMLQTLSECLPACKSLTQADAWKTLKVDLTDPCFMPSPGEAMLEALIKSPPKTPRSVNANVRGKTPSY